MCYIVRVKVTLFSGWAYYALDLILQDLEAWIVVPFSTFALTRALCCKSTV